MKTFIYFIISVLIILQSCKKEADENKSTEFDYQSLIIPPKGFPEIPFPVENKFTKERYILGKKLFYDSILSIDNTKNCASCHKLEYALADNVPISPGVKNRLGTRNAPTLFNVAYHTKYLREGSLENLERQVQVPIQEVVEFAHNIVDIYNQMLTIPEYVNLSLQAYGRPPDAYVITRAIATFERTLISGNSAFDKYTYQGNENALTENQRKGLKLFMSARTNCSVCHSGFNFTNYEILNNGMYEKYSDPGLARLNENDDDFAKFKVASLRNITLTAPYMHNGGIATLQEVIEIYNQGGKGFRTQDPRIKPLNLSDLEKQQLLDFLNSLTDYEAISNTNILP